MVTNLTLLRRVSAFLLYIATTISAIQIREEWNRYLVQYETKNSYQVGHDSIIRKGRLHASFPNDLIDVIYLDEDEVNEWQNSPGVISFGEDRLIESPEWPSYDNSRLMKSDSEDSDSEQIPYGITMLNASGVSQDYISNQKICIIDTGYDLEHIDLPSNVTGASFIRGLDWKLDVHGHGTHVAGTIAALGGNNEGVVGVLSTGGVQLHIARAKDDIGSAFESEVIAAFNNCEEVGANIINYSAGQIYPSTALESVVNRLHDESNMLIFSAAGNGGPGYILYPAYYNGAISVGNVNIDKKVSFDSATNKHVELVAPGVDVLSTEPGNSYKTLSGTSMACPHATAVAALVWSHFPDRSAQDIRRYLQMSANDLGSKEGRDRKFGFGFVDAGKAFHMLSNNILLPPTVSPTDSPTRRPCPDENIEIYLEIETDAFGRETSWELADLIEGEGKVIESGSGYVGNMFYWYTLCVPCSSYQFRFLDTHGDGNEGGYYYLDLGGETTIYKGGRDFGYEDMTNFIPDECQNRGLTLPPTQAPTTFKTTEKPSSKERKKSKGKKEKKSKKQKQIKGKKKSKANKGIKSKL